MAGRIGLRSWLGIALLGAALLACSNPTDDKPNVLPSLKADAAGLPGDATASSATCSCLAAGQWFRFDTLKLKSLDGKADHPVIPTLNNLWQQDIDHFELNFYVKVEEVADGKVKLRVVNGARTDEPPNPNDKVCSSSDDLAKQTPTTCLLDNPAKIEVARRNTTAETVDVVVAAALRRHRRRVRRPSHLAPHHHRDVVQQPALLQIADQTGDRQIDRRAQASVIVLQFLMRVPHAVRRREDLHEPHSALDQPSRGEARSRRCRGLGNQREATVA